MVKRFFANLSIYFIELAIAIDGATVSEDKVYFQVNEF
jgi:hypothetical protein